MSTNKSWINRVVGVTSLQVELYLNEDQDGVRPKERSGEKEESGPGRPSNRLPSFLRGFEFTLQ